MITFIVFYIGSCKLDLAFYRPLLKSFLQNPSSPNPLLSSAGAAEVAEENLSFFFFFKQFLSLFLKQSEVKRDQIDGRSLKTSAVPQELRNTVSCPYACWTRTSISSRKNNFLVFLISTHLFSHLLRLLAGKPATKDKGCWPSREKASSSDHIPTKALFSISLR